MGALSITNYRLLFKPALSLDSGKPAVRSRSSQGLHASPFKAALTSLSLSCNPSQQITCVRTAPFRRRSRLFCSSTWALQRLVSLWNSSIVTPLRRRCFAPRTLNLSRDASTTLSGGAQRIMPLSMDVLKQNLAFIDVTCKVGRLKNKKEPRL
jgi:hypothetical protein